MPTKHLQESKQRTCLEPKADDAHPRDDEDDSKDSSSYPARHALEGTSEKITVFAAAILPLLPIATIRAIAKKLDVVPNGYRPGQAPRNSLVRAVGKAVRNSGAGLIVVNHCMGETGELGRIVQSTKLKDLPHRLEELLSQFEPVFIVLWLMADSRRGAVSLAERFLRPQKGGPASQEGDFEPAEREGAPSDCAGAKGPSSLAHELDPHRAGGAPEARGSTEGRRRVRKAATAGRKDEVETSRLIRRVARLERQLQAARREAGAAGEQLGQLRRRVRELERERDRLEAKKLRMAAPTVVETATFLARDVQLQASEQEAERLRAERDNALREAEQSGVLYRRAQRTNERLRLEISRSPLVAASPEGLSVTATFSYEGPGGVCRLKKGYGIAVPAAIVRKLDLMDGDVVDLSLTTAGGAECRVVAAVPRRVCQALAAVAALPGAPHLGWQALPVPAGRFSDEKPLGPRPLGWICRHDAQRFGLEDGDLVTICVSGPEPGGDPGSPPSRVPAALPVVKVLRAHAMPDATQPAGEKQVGTGRARRGKIRPLREANRRTRGFSRPPARPLLGKSVLIVGGDSFQVNYRSVVRALGAEACFLGADGTDPARTRAAARAADVTVIMTAYVSHKVEDVIKAALRPTARRAVRVNSTGQKALLDALMTWAREEGAVKKQCRPSPNRSA